jgi:hypothetical protein
MQTLTDETIRVASMDLCTELLQLPTPQLCKILQSLHRICPCLCDPLHFLHLNHLAQVDGDSISPQIVLVSDLILWNLFFFWALVLIYFLKCLILKIQPFNQSMLFFLVIFFIWLLIFLFIYFFFLRSFMKYFLKNIYHLTLNKDNKFNKLTQVILTFF